MGSVFNWWNVEYPNVEKLGVGGLARDNILDVSNRTVSNIATGILIKTHSILVMISSVGICLGVMSKFGPLERTIISYGESRRVDKFTTVCVRVLRGWVKFGSTDSYFVCCLGLNLMILFACRKMHLKMP